MFVRKNFFLRNIEILFQNHELPASHNLGHNIFVYVVYELPHELPNDVRFRILGNKEILVKSQIWVET